MRKKHVKIGIPMGGSWPMDVLVDNCRYAESMGVDCFWTTNRAAPADREPLVTLAVLAQSLKKARVGAWSIDPYLYHPLTVSRAIAQIDEMAPGRVLLGWTPGTWMILGSLGFPESIRPLGVMREAVEFSKLCLRGGVPEGAVEDKIVRQTAIPDEYLISYQGKHFTMSNNIVLPPRKVPVMVSSFSPKMLQLAGELADEVGTGWFAIKGANEWALEQIEIGAKRGGRTLDDLVLHRSIHICAWPDRKVAMETISPISTVVLFVNGALRKRFGIKLPMEETPGSVMDASGPMFEAMSSMGLKGYMGASDLGFPEDVLLTESVAGTPDECVEQLKEKVLHPGFDVLNFAPFAPEPEAENWRKAVKILMEDVVPKLGLPGR
jgi:alkanesulfonate monooxygenase SsuD/methylene tetrahydromethanopterin reductase-like flavin-dependent oxidoreductase (luciferase family)